MSEAPASTGVGRRRRRQSGFSEYSAPGCFLQSKEHTQSKSCGKIAILEYRDDGSRPRTVHYFYGIVIFPAVFRSVYEKLFVGLLEGRTE